MLVVERMIELRLLCNNFAYFLECLLATKLEFTFANFDINKVCFFFFCGKCQRFVIQHLLVRVSMLSCILTFSQKQLSQNDMFSLKQLFFNK